MPDNPQMVDICGAYTATTGTADYLISGTPGNRASFADNLTDGQSVAYYVQYDTPRPGYEGGVGHWDAGASTLVVDSIDKSSNSDAKVSWGAGQKRIELVASKAMLEDLYAVSNAIFAGGQFPTNNPQTIPVKTWTAVVWDNVPTNDSDVVLQPDKITWRRLQNVKRSSGLWNTIGSVAWENTDAALVGVHRRKIRLTISNPSAFGGAYLPWVERDCALYHPDMPDKSEPSYGDVIMQDGYAWAGLQTELADMRIEVWHNAEVPIRILPVGFHAPLLMSAKMSEYG